ncbi:MAG: hypothetical protein AUH13_18460 [Acidobacteria bacterium 13_2_20CM_58_27]|nr:MAG: hypothetical protein AUH13_18460 [Acidobacteria bacterium 13_2_20CM_58_27]
MVSGLVIFSHSCFLKPQEHVQSGFDDQVYGGSGMIWTRMLAYITGTVDQELLLRNEYLAEENQETAVPPVEGALRVCGVETWRSLENRY